MKKLIAALLVAASAIPASATVLTYNLSGTYSDGAVLGGHFSFDTAGSIFSQLSNIDVTVNGAHLNEISGLGYDTFDPTVYRIDFGTSLGLVAGIDIVGTRNGAALTSITSQILGPQSLHYDGSNVNYGISAGTITLANGAAAVPEPAMLGLFGMGAIGLGLSRRRSGNSLA